MHGQPKSFSGMLPNRQPVPGPPRWLGGQASSPGIGLSTGPPQSPSVPDMAHIAQVTTFARPGAAFNSTSPPAAHFPPGTAATSEFARRVLAPTFWRSAPAANTFTPPRQMLGGYQSSTSAADSYAPAAPMQMPVPAAPLQTGEGDDSSGPAAPMQMPLPAAPLQTGKGKGKNKRGRSRSCSSSRSRGSLQIDDERLVEGSPREVRPQGDSFGTDTMSDRSPAPMSDQSPERSFRIKDTSKATSMSLSDDSAFGQSPVAEESSAISESSRILALPGTCALAATLDEKVLDIVRKAHRICDDSDGDVVLPGQPVEEFGYQLRSFVCDLWVACVKKPSPDEIRAGAWAFFIIVIWGNVATRHNLAHIFSAAALGMLLNSARVEISHEQLREEWQFVRTLAEPLLHRFEIAVTYMNRREGRETLESRILSDEVASRVKRRRVEDPGEDKRDGQASDEVEEDSGPAWSSKQKARVIKHLEKRTKERQKQIAKKGKGEGNDKSMNAKPYETKNIDNEVVRSIMEHLEDSHALILNTWRVQREAKSGYWQLVV